MCMYMGDWTRDQTAGYPMSNEILERTIRTVKNTLDKARKTGIDPYLAMLSIRATPSSDKIPSPAKLLLDCKINMPSYATPLDKREIIMQQLTQRKHSQEFYLDRHARTRHPLTHGDQITLKNTITSTLERPCVVSGNDIQEIYRRHLGPRSFEARNIPNPPYHMAIKHGEVEETRTKVGIISKPPVRYKAWRRHDRYMNS